MTFKESIFSTLFLIFFFSCSPPKSEEPADFEQETLNNKPKIAAPFFNADSAYHYVQQQVAFGPRIPGTKAHEKCSSYLSAKLKSFGMEVIVQNAVATTYDSKKFNMSNIIAQYNLQKPKRILLCAHWDTRPFADRDSVNPSKPFDGANDGGSSVAVLLEIARQLSLSKPGIGIDIILFDLEDYGDQSGNVPNSWCLGSQYWARNMHKPDYYAQYGILLDMVGGKNAVFPKEGSSMHYASSVVNKVWGIAKQSGYGQYFIDAETPPTTDDHVYVNELAHIPTIDIVHYDAGKKDYMSCHHRHCDNMDIIDTATLKIVGQVVLEVVFAEVNAMQ